MQVQSQIRACVSLCVGAFLSRAVRCTVGLPVWQAKGDFIKMINEHQTTILVGETGSGKTTQIAQFITEAGKSMDTMAGAPLVHAMWMAGCS